MHRTILYIVLSSFLVIYLTGCASFGDKNTLNTSRVGEGVDSYKACFTDRKIDLPVRVAILPFENMTDREKAGELVRNSFYSQFATKKYRDVELFEIDEILDENGLYENNKFSDVDTARLGKILGADGIVYGKITGYNKLHLGIYSQVYVELEVKLVEASTSNVIWQAKHRTARHEGDIPFELIGIVSAMLRTTKNISEAELVQATDELCRTIVCALPEPEVVKVYAKGDQSRNQM
jgi:hypothetical protein